MTALWVTLVLASPFDANERVLVLRDLLAAVADSPAEELEDTYGFIDVIDRNECRSAYHRLRAQCLIETARRYCRGQRSRASRRACTSYSDVIITNKLSEDHFITVLERYLIMREHRDFRSRLRVELRRRYGALVTELGLSPRAPCARRDFDCLANTINAYCLDLSDTRSLSWQHCVAAVVWFIGTAEAD